MLSCHNRPAAPAPVQAQTPALQCGAERTELYFPLLKAKRIGIIANQSSRLGSKHLLDTLLAAGMDVRRIFSPEHGFRGTADAGAKIEDGRDPRTGLPVISLYGKNRKPTPDQLHDLDVMIFDIQDVGARFYTYISTLHYVMEACAEQHIPLIILDRPNPNGHYVDGPVLDTAFRSFVGMHPVPIVHGMTIGEYGRMINGEGWLKNGIRADLTVIPCAGYNHQTRYVLPIKPSPNLPNERSILLYPSLCLFEGTCISVGRGTNSQFQVIGHPDWPQGDTVFTPVPNPGARHPKLEGQTCRGISFRRLTPDSLRSRPGLHIEWLVRAYRQFPDKAHFFLKTNHFDRLAGTDQLRKQIIEGKSAQEIKDSWQPALQRFRATRQQYLLYHP